MTTARGPRAASDLSAFLGLRWTEPGVVRMEVRGGTVNDVGLLLGPIAFALVDYGMTAVVWDALADEEQAATINVAVNFVDGVADDEVVCVSTLDRRTHRIAAASSELLASDGRLLATAIGTFAIRRAWSSTTTCGRRQRGA